MGLDNASAAYRELGGMLLREEAGMSDEVAVRDSKNATGP